MGQNQLPPLPPESEFVIRTARLELRPVRRDDAAVMFKILVDPILYEHTHGSPPESIEALAALYESRESRQSPDGGEYWLNWIIRPQNSAEAIGFMQATVTKNHTSIAWVVGTTWQRNGYASEATQGVINWLRARGIKQIRACISPSHTASKKVATNAGLRQTGQFLDGEEIWEL